MPSPDPAAPTTPVSLFYSYAHEDEPLRDELAGHLKILERRGLIQAWHDRQIRPGQAWDQAIDQHLSTADLVLLLVSKDFIGSDYIWGIELAQTMKRQQARQCEVVPIIVRAVDIDPSDADDLPFLKLQGLPPDLKPVTSWANRDEAWTQVAKGLRATVNAIRARRSAAAPAPVPAPPPPAAAAADPPKPEAVGRRPPASGDIDIGDLFKGGRVLADPGADSAGSDDSAESDDADVCLGAAAPPPEPAARPPQDPQLDALVDGFVAQVDQAQQQRGGPPLYDHHRYAMQREAMALIDRPEPMRVLWVDDQPDGNRAERSLLARLQIEVVAVASTADALARCAADAQAGEPFDLVISDWSRPAEGPDAALRLLHALRSAGNPLPVIIYHGDFDAASRQDRSARAQAAGALGDAVMPAELMALVQQAMRA